MLYKIYSAIAYFISRNLFKIGLLVFFKYRVTGRENIPKKGPFIMASNHVSYMDPPAIGAASRKRLYFISSEHLCKNRLLAFWYKSVGCLIIKREESDHSMMKKILHYLKEGKPIAIFPEGTRSEDGAIKEPLSGAGFIALKSQAPVIPCFVKGTEKALPRGAKAFKKSGVTVYVGSPIDPKDFKFEGKKKDSYRLFSKKIMNCIAQIGKRYGD
ncbi:MAG: 1-acyl-sn-glycerol-3-phosphate acyltransferase [Candidatus Omnitrophica bacterium]|nr:1-acyl-sn-glycerol-3-phosphate acyltransferase [Candidatus Omnitrophota bacterium]